MGYYMAGGYYQGGGFFSKIGKLVGKVAPAISLINPALGGALMAGSKIAGALGGSGGGAMPPAFPGVGHGGRRMRRARRRRY